MRSELPFASAGQRIGLFGGSFDPAHEGHVHLTRQALVRFELDQVWWLVSPGNPLKARGPAPLVDRMAQARRMMDHPRVKVTDIESKLGTRYTAQTIAALRARYPHVRFTWLMGADNLVQFDQWQDWRWIAQSVPIGVLARPGDRINARTSKTARVFEHAQLPAKKSQLLAGATAPAWCFVNIPMLPISSSALRAKGSWPK